ncbi:MAG: hypothetical protein ABJE47_05315 [bacterium]
MFVCPNCQHVVGEYPEQGVVAVVCASCTFKYEISGGLVKAFTSRQVQLRGPSQGQRAVYGRLFELTVAPSTRETLRFTFQTDRDDPWIHIAPGDRAAVVYGMRGEKRDGLLFVVNRSSAERFIIGKPGDRSKYWSVIIGFGVAIVGGVVAGAISAPALVVVAVAALSGLVCAKIMARVLKPKHVLQPEELLVLRARQQLLAEKRTIMQLRSEVAVEIDARVTLKRRLGDLRSRMSAVQLEAYATRIAATDRALQSLDAQLDVDRQLVREYDRTLEIIDIEYDSSVAADEISSEGSTVMQDRLAELRSAEERRAETTRQLSANAEVEELLRGHSA